MSIYITGDCHGDYRRFSTEIFPEQYTMGKNDYVIVCGDFGYWSEDREQLWWRKWLDKKPFTTLWVDGMQIATFCGQQGRISRTVRAILSGQL